MVNGIKEEDPAPRHHNSEQTLRRALQRIEDNSDQNNKEPLQFSSRTPNSVSTTVNCPFRQLAAPALYRNLVLTSFILRNLKLLRVPSKACFSQTLHVAVVHRETHARAWDGRSYRESSKWGLGAKTGFQKGSQVRWSHSSLCSSIVLQHCRHNLGIGIRIWTWRSQSPFPTALILILQCYLRTACQCCKGSQSPLQHSFLNAVLFVSSTGRKNSLQWHPSPNSACPFCSCVQKLQEVLQSQEQWWKKATWAQE